jgi:hypothetical protein
MEYCCQSYRSIPRERSSYLGFGEYIASIRSHYVDETGAVLKSSREHPAIQEMPPIGTWRIDDYRGNYGHEISRLITIDLNALELPELCADGRLSANKRGDDLRYAGWLSCGLRSPGIETVETEHGGLRVIDGHRRVLAHRLAGLSTIEGWVYPTTDHPDGARDWRGRLMKVGMTFELGCEGSRIDDQVLAGTWQDARICV